MSVKCRELDRTMMESALQCRGMVSYTCHAGMREAVIPLFADSLLAGYVMIGQFRSREAPGESPYGADWTAGYGDTALQ